MSAPDVAALLARHPLEWSVEDEGLVYEETAGLSYIGHASDIVPALATALRAALADQRRECEWRYMYWPESESAFDTGCGKSWEFADGGIAENGVVFCHHCGGKVIAPEISKSCIDCGDEISATATRCNDCDAALTADGGGV